MKSWFKNKWNKGKMLAELKPALFLSLTFCFMIFIYAPLEFYINNSNEFWYDAYLLFPFILKDFLLFFVIAPDGADAVHADNKRTVHADKFVRRKFFLHVLHTA